MPISLMSIAYVCVAIPMAYIAPKSLQPHFVLCAKRLMLSAMFGNITMSSLIGENVYGWAAQPCSMILTLLMPEQLHNMCVSLVLFNLPNALDATVRALLSVPRPLRLLAAALMVVAGGATLALDWSMVALMSAFISLYLGVHCIATANSPATQLAERREREHDATLSRGEIIANMLNSAIHLVSIRLLLAMPPPTLAPTPLPALLQ